MTTSSAASDRRRRRAGYSLVETIVVLTLTGLVLAGVMSAFIFFGKSAKRELSYAQMETEARRALEVMARDVRAASDITWAANEDVTRRFTLVDAARNAQIVYTVTNAGALVRTERIGNQPAQSRILVRNIIDPSIRYLKLNGGALTPDAGRSPSINPLEVKLIQVVLVARVKETTVAATTNYLISASFVLRNKRVTA